MKALLYTLTFIASFSATAQDPPKIGLTLGGGGAKGLAHIGILKAIDSAGLKIDYITGTSMGSVVGALYAAGYSGNDIEKIARELNWDELFASSIELPNISPDEKKEFNNYAVEVPFEKSSLKIGTGILEGQTIWLKFQELFLPVYNIKDFNKFSIPFRCIATDMQTGKPFVFKEGEIVTAIRASMAIPSIFTAVDYNDTKLVDGGVVRNFPVLDVKEMGADIAIGVNVSHGLLPADKLNSAVDIIYQMAFFKDADDLEIEMKLCDYLIEPNIDGFSAGSFSASDSILAIGNEEGKKHYAYFKKLADSIQQYNSSDVLSEDRLPNYKKIIVDEIQLVGLKNTTKTFVLGRLGIEKGKAYGGEEMSEAIRLVYGSRLYSLIKYKWIPTTDGHAIIHLELRENPSNYLKAGIHFHSFSGVSLIANITARNTLMKNSKSTLKLNVGENLRGYASHQQAIGKKQNSQFTLSYYYESLPLPIYEDFIQSLLYRTNRNRFDFNFNQNFGLNFAAGLGTYFENFGLKPDISPTFVLEATTKYLNSYGYLSFNTLEQKVYPSSGSVFTLRGALIYGQHSDLTFYLPDEEPQQPNVDLGNFLQFQLDYRKYYPLSKQWTLLSEIQTGINFNYDEASLNFFPIGGSFNFLHNQITFVGLNEYEVNSPSVGTLLGGVQYAIGKNFIAMVRANIGVYDFINDNSFDFADSSFLSGYALTLGYRSPLGPIEVSSMYSDQSKNFIAYINIGYTF